MGRESISILVEILTVDSGWMIYDTDTESLTMLSKTKDMKALGNEGLNQGAEVISSRTEINTKDNGLII
jgi:hypothetical protein